MKVEDYACSANYWRLESYKILQALLALGSFYQLSRLFKNPVLTFDRSFRLEMLMKLKKEILELSPLDLLFARWCFKDVYRFQFEGSNC